MISRGGITDLTENLTSNTTTEAAKNKETAFNSLDFDIQKNITHSYFQCKVKHFFKNSFRGQRYHKQVRLGIFCTQIIGLAYLLSVFVKNAPLASNLSGRATPFSDESFCERLIWFTW